MSLDMDQQCRQDHTPEEKERFFTELITEYKQQVRAICYKFKTHGRIELEDLEQTAYLAIWKSIPKIRGDWDAKRLKGFINTVVRNALCQLRRKKDVLLDALPLSAFELEDQAADDD